MRGFSPPPILQSGGAQAPSAPISPPMRQSSYTKKPVSLVR